MRLNKMFKMYWQINNKILIKKIIEFIEFI